MWKAQQGEILSPLSPFHSPEISGGNVLRRGLTKRESLWPVVVMGTKSRQCAWRCSAMLSGGIKEGEEGRSLLRLERKGQRAEGRRPGTRDHRMKS